MKIILSRHHHHGRGASGRYNPPLPVRLPRHCSSPSTLTSSPNNQSTAPSSITALASSIKPYAPPTLHSSASLAAGISPNMFQATRRLLQHRQPLIKFIGKHTAPASTSRSPHSSQPRITLTNPTQKSTTPRTLTQLHQSLYQTHSPPTDKPSSSMVH